MLNTMNYKVVEERKWGPINSLVFRVFEADCIFYKADRSLEFKMSIH